MRNRVIAIVMVAAVAVTLCACLPKTLEVQMPEGTALTEEKDGQKIYVEAVSPEVNDRRTITVTATGEVKKMPDVACVTAGVLSEGRRQAALSKDNAEKIDAIMQSLAEFGVSADDVRTQSYSVSPTYDAEGKISGYSVYNEIVITVHDIDNTGEVIDVCTEAGANVAGSVSFDYSDAQTATNEAVAAAIEAAMAKGGVMAKAAGVSIAGIVSVSESTYYTDAVRNYYEPKAEVAAEDTASVSTQISSGDMTFTANVTVVFEIAY